MNKKLSLKVHGQSIVEQRRKLGWSQEELSRRSGYSIRLVRKAEAGGSIRADTLQTICDTFAQAGCCIKVDDLVCNILSVAQRIVYCYDHFGRDLLKHCGELFTDDMVYHIHADPAQVPYAGRWVGKDGFQQMLDIFHDMFTRRPGTLQPTFLVGDDRVHARFLDQAVYKGEETRLFTSTFTFSSGVSSLSNGQ